MRPALEGIVEALLARSEDRRVVTLDEVGDALGTEVASSEDVDAIFARLEAAGRSIVAGEEVDLKDRLRRVLAAARTLEAHSGRRPTSAELARATDLHEGAVRAALMLGRVLGR